MTHNWNRTGVMALACLGVLVFSASCMKRSTKDTKAKKEEPASEQESSKVEVPPVEREEIGDSSSRSEGGAASGSESATGPASGPSLPPNPYGSLGSQSDDGLDGLDGSRNPYADSEGNQNIPNGSPSTQGRPAEMEKLVGDWSGVNNEPDPERVWEVVTANSGDAGADRSEDGGREFFDRSGDEVDCLSAEAETSDARTFVFVIKQGAGVNGWNQRNNPCLVKAGRTLKFVNADDTPHMPHFNGEVCQHPDPVRDVMEKDRNPTYTCTPQQPTRLIQTYDHLAGQGSASQLFIQVIP